MTSQGEFFFRQMHDHHHDAIPSQDSSQLNRAFKVGITLNLLFVIIEVISGLSIGSLSLLSDAGHNFIDVVALFLSLLAFRFEHKRATDEYTYGFRKTTILASLLNGMLLLFSVGGITYEAIRRFRSPEILPGDSIALVAGIGILINGISAYLFFHHKEKDINVKGAYLHLFADAVVSLTIVLGGIAIYYTKQYWIDPLLSLVVVGVIFWNTWGLFRESLKLSLDGVPKNINLENVKKECLQIPHVQDIHHIHIWAMSTTQNAMTAHIVLSAEVSEQEEHEAKVSLRNSLAQLNITHLTLETERTDISCQEIVCETEEE